ncbi:MAG: site-2 protease family protein, partial [Myxococcota bacterium]|nr:site-2 protease family protein [Myxococcota bacterium]
MGRSSVQSGGPDGDVPVGGGVLVFRASGRTMALRSLVVLAAATFLGLIAGLRLPEALLVAAATALGHIGLTYWVRIASYGIRLDERGIERLDPRNAVLIPWDEVRSLDLAETPIEIRGRPVRLRYIVVEGSGGERILFSDLSIVGSPAIRIDVGGPQRIADVRDSGILLGLIADRIGDYRYLPAMLAERPGPARAGDGGEAVEAKGPGERRRVSVAGLLVLVLKVGTKIAKGIPAALKTFKPGLALASGAAFSVLFSWQFALAVMIMLAFHEYGHVHAMRRCGMKVRGIYFIPIVGAAAVTEDVWRTRSQQAYIALSGPLWGLALTAVAAAADVATDHRHPFLGVAIAWWSLINLFNLLPVSPLDGGRVLSAAMHSIGTRFGLAVSLGMIAAALALTFALDVTLLAVVGAIGLLEFAGEASALMRFRAVRSSP